MFITLRYTLLMFVVGSLYQYSLLFVFIVIFAGSTIKFKSIRSLCMLIFGTINNRHPAVFVSQMNYGATVNYVLYGPKCPGGP